MISKLKKELYFRKLDLMFQKGARENKITPFDEEFLSQLEQTYINCVPVSINIKYLKPTRPPGKCYDRSLEMFFCFKDAILVRGDNKDLELKYGKENAGHGWIELNGYVYDPSLMYKIDKDLYYKMFEPSNIHKCTIEEYCAIGENRGFYEKIKNTTKDDFRIGGKRRTELLVMIPLLKAIAENSDNPSFIEDLNKWLEEIQYDEQQIYETMNEEIKKLSI